MAWALAKHEEIVARRNGAPIVRKPSASPHTTVEDLIRDYLASPTFGRLRSETQADYRRKFDAVLYRPRARNDRRPAAEREREPFSLAPARAVGYCEVWTLFEYLVAARGQTMARQTIITLSAAYKWARKSTHWRGMINPCSELGLPKPGRRVVTWTIDEVRAIVAAADHPAIDEPEIGDAIVLGLFTGQSRGDILSLRGGGISDGIIRLIRGKTGKRLEIPVIPPLAERLDRMKARRCRTGFTAPELVLSKHSGKPLTGHDFAHRFIDLRRRVAAGIPDAGLAPFPTVADTQFRDLRDTLLSWLSDAGCDLQRIAGVSGHEIASVAQVIPHYIAPGRADAAQAMTALEAWMEQQGMKL
ncbi:MAG: tyrosine-type recombinase/integrase [Rhodovulum sp.]|nr:tyrosine-type recombinase/integrase [Rhodovulum sp.]